ncbi:MAG: heme-binding protein [Rubrimonas sp.]|uniref:SOUL family heme-binding protein n=1 Tax=Rubrimonas sp. TaxID=2036015 RepID=UPI002FDEDE4E
MRRIVVVLAAALGGVAALAAGAWLYVTLTIETPAYRVVASDGARELRDYPAMVLAETRTQGPRRAALGDGFRPLARYIFASEREGQKIAMTAPVVQTGGPEGWTVGFVMPSEHELNSLPSPGPAPVSLREAPPARMAALRFSGVATDAALAEREAELRGWMAAKGLAPSGPPIFAYYNDPWTPGPLRRNEVLIPVGAPASAASG